jgi:hypothetical protein
LSSINSIYYWGVFTVETIYTQNICTIESKMPKPAWFKWKEGLYCVLRYYEKLRFVLKVEYVSRINMGFDIAIYVLVIGRGWEA